MNYFIEGRTAPVLFEDCVGSTSTALKELAGNGAAHGTVLIARRQTGGRGRLGRSFESPPGGLYMSMLLRTALPPERTVTVTPLAAIAVCRAVETLCGLTPEIKWPNDVQLSGKKLCGILTEMSAEKSGARLVLGIGVNVNTRLEDFSPALRNTACSIFTHTGRYADISALAGELIRELDSLFPAWEKDGSAILPEYRRRCTTVGRDILVLQNGVSTSARAVGINDDMSLRVITGSGEMSLRFGEVTVRTN